MVDENYLREIRRNGEAFTDVREYYERIKSILGDGSKISVVIGYAEEHPENLEIMHISPWTEADRLRVEMFCGGIEAWINELDYTNRHSISNLRESPFEARIDLGVDRKTTEERGSTVLTTGFDLDGISYDLNISWHDDRHRKIFYKSQRTLRMPKSFEVLRKFDGPNYEMRRDRNRSI